MSIIQNLFNKKVISQLIVKTDRAIFINFAIMRILYILFYPFISLTILLFYKRIKSVNKPKAIFNRTVYASNHAASFMDPLVVATSNRAVVYFMTRSDVFTTISKPFLWAFHMLPIYRQQDGVDTKEKNAEVFQKCTDALAAKKNLLIYPEGLTDDVFIRRLKPIKKGAVRIGFIALESNNWKEKVYVAAIGCNYMYPNAMRSENEVEPLLVIAAYILDFLCIHPFRDGNGRMARLLSLLMLYQAGYEVGRYVSLERVIENSKESYYDTLYHSSLRWHDGQHSLTPWTHYWLGTITAAYG
ncbi:MAG: hypothetical protein EBU01_05440, partial [Crocinitomicaceae bacterium]|nr:hypothetical protein [Crocinitomicaceae bacterium]